MNKRCLQIAVGIGCSVPIMAGLIGIVFGPHMVGDNVTVSISMDSHFRYLSGLLVGIGLGFLSTIPDIEKQTKRFRLLTGMVVLGGLARLISLLAIGLPNYGMLFGLVMELVIVPLLAFWQNIVAREAPQI